MTNIENKNLTSAEAEILAAVLDQNIHVQLNALIEALSSAIKKRYGLCLSLGALAQELHAAQKEADENIVQDDEIAIGGGGIMLVGLGLLLAPLTGGASEAVAFSLVVASESAQLVGAGMQAYGEAAAAYSHIDSARKANEIVSKAQSQLEQHEPDLDLVVEHLRAYHSSVEHAYEIMVANMRAISPHVSIPTLEEFKRIISLVNSLPSEDLDKLVLLAKGGGKAITVASFAATNASRLLSVIRLLKIAVIKGIDTSALLLMNIRGVRRIVGEENRVAPVPPSVVDEVAAAGGVEAEVAEVELRSVMDYELENPGVVVKLLEKALEAKGITNALKKAGYLAAGLNVVLTTTSIVMDSMDLKDAQDRIKEKSWSEAAKNIEKVRIRTEAQMQYLFMLRATFDLGLFEEPYCFIQHSKTQHYLSSGEVRTSWGEKVSYLNFSLEKKNTHLNNLDLQFSGLVAPTSKSNNADIPYTFLTHRLSGKTASVNGSNFPYIFDLYTEHQSTQFKFKIIDDKDKSGWLCIQDANVNADILAALGPDFPEPKPMSPRAYGHDVNDEIEKSPEDKSQLRFAFLPGASPDQLFVHSYGYLRYGNKGPYMTYDHITNKLKLTDNRPEMLAGVFALTGNSCLQHRFTGRCVKPSPSGSFLITGLHPQSECRWEWGPASLDKAIKGRALVNVQTNKSLTIAITLTDSSSTGGGEYMELSDGISGEWVFEPVQV